MNRPNLLVRSAATGVSSLISAENILSSAPMQWLELPQAIWPLFFRRDALLDFGLRPRGFREHAWIYALCVVVMVPVLLIVSRQPEFTTYYPIYKLAGRSWLDFWVWEAMYIAQFLGL